MKIGKERKKYKACHHSRKSCFPLSKTIFFYVVCPTVIAIQEKNRTKQNKKQKQKTKNKKQKKQTTKNKKPY